MKKRILSLGIILGFCLILGSLCLILGSQFRIRQGTQECNAVLSQVNNLLSERTQGTPEGYPNTEMPALDIHETDYIGLLEIPAFGIALPVSDDWTNKDLYCAPSRFCGSVYDHSLVIGGGDYTLQFAFCDKIDIGTLVVLTDLTGAEFPYCVSRVDRSEQANAQWLAHSDFDLTLFCRDTYSMEYIAVRCRYTAKNLK